jgi:large subunit ribosomal protein L13
MTMKTTKSNYTIKRATHRIDATDQTVGRLATKIATLLRGKQKASFTPHVDNGDFVVVENADKVKLTGKKLEQKTYKTHSLFPGGLKVVSAKKLMAEDPKKIIENAVFYMLPKNKLQTEMFKRLMVK